MKRTLSLLAVFAVSTQAVAQQSAEATSPSASVQVGTASAPFRATERAALAGRAVQAPTLDGKLDDAAWKNAPIIDQFLEYEPTTGATPRFRTEVRILYDDKYLYVMGRMYDPAPDSIISLLSRRDVRTESEQLKLVIDSYHDRRTAYQFITNPAGVKRDFYVYNDNTEDATWDAVWDVSTSIDSLGWTAEFRIPFSQIRFNRDADKTFGLLIVRDVARTRQRISWPLYRRDKQGYVSQGGEVSGIQGLPQPRRLEVTPYVVSKNETRLERTGKFSNPQSQTAGADLKYGVGSNLTLDATINPDFGQVEADPSILNLGAFEQLFEERRPFFLEGAGIYQFRTACGDIDTGCTGLFYSRRIGRAPQLGSTYRDPANPTATRILGAAKLSGRLSSGTSIGVLSSITDRERGGSEGQTLEPQSSYTIARVQQDLRGGQSGLGGMVTMTKRSLDQFTENTLRENAYTGGVDFRHRFFKNNYEFTAYVAGSSVDGSASSIAATQRSSVHQYNRPDDDLTYDPTLTRLTGDAERMSLSKFGGGITRFQSVLERFSPGFESNDVGFLTRADQQMFRNWFSLQFLQPTKVYRRLQANFNTFNAWNNGGLQIGQNFNTNWHMELKNTWWVHGGTNFNDQFATYDDRVSRGGPAVRRSPSRNWNVGIEFDRRKWYTPVVFTGQGYNDEGNSRFWWVEPSLQFRVSSRFNAQANFYYEHAENDDQWVGNITPTGSSNTSYTFARLNQHTMRMTGRINYTATPTLSMQLYAQPFISSGEYTKWRELTSPRAERYPDRYTPFRATNPEGFNVREFRSNTVIRWEYRPASTLFFVWQQGRTGNDPTRPNFDFNRDVNGVFGLHPMNTFLIKASYWFNP